MKIVLVTPASARERTGNRVTALRWARMLRSLGHRVTVTTAWYGGDADLMLALHARRSAGSIQRFHRIRPDRPLLVVLTGTDLYRDIWHTPASRRSLEMANLLVTLQPEGRRMLPARWRRKTRVVFQSAPAGRRLPPEEHFPVCVVGHLREEKDPFRCARALAHLDPTSQVRVLHLGRALDTRHEVEAKRLESAEGRYRWLGELPRRQVREVMRRSRLLVVSSRMEGGANVIAEALAVGLPVLASRVSGNLGMLGPDYLGYFPVGDERALAALLECAERNPFFYEMLARQCRRRARLMTPSRERQRLATVVAEAVKTARRTAAAGRRSRSPGLLRLPARETRH